MPTAFGLTSARGWKARTSTRCASALQYFIDEAHLLPLLERYAAIVHEGYYVRMAVAWGVSYAYIAFPEVTLAFLRQERLPAWTHNKAIQKICESRRVDKAEKEALRALKREG